MNVVNVEEKSFEEKELELAEKELKEKRMELEELENRIEWIKENIAISKALKEQLVGLKWSKIEVHTSSQYNIRVEIETAQRGLSSKDLEEIASIVKPWYPNGIQEFETYFNEQDGKQYIRIWF